MARRNKSRRRTTIVMTALVTSAVWAALGSVYLASGDRPKAPVPKRGAERITSDTPTALPGLSAAKPSDEDAPDTPSASERAAAEKEAARLIIPVLNVSASQLSNSFLDKRGAENRTHQAIDIPAPEGTTIIAAGPGTIERLFFSRSAGNTIYVRSPDGTTIHYYAHLARYAEGLREGQWIRRGQRLGEVGSTGSASPFSPHLHFAIMRTAPDAEWWEPASSVNPYPLLIAGPETP